MIKVENLSKEYTFVKNKSMLVLKNISLEIKKGEFCVLLGASGAGKSTFLKCISGLEKATSGDIYLNEKNIGKFTDEELRKLRRNDIGYIFQSYNLISDLTMHENIALDNRVIQEIEDLVDKWDLRKIMNKFPDQCSGGQQQKVTILRALLKNTDIIFCDEPTGALDSHSARDVLLTLQQVQNDYNKTIVVVTHNSLMKEIANRIITMHDGSILDVETNSNPKNVGDIEW